MPSFPSQDSVDMSSAPPPIMRLTYDSTKGDDSLNNTSLTEGNDGSLMIDEVEMSGCD